MLGASKYDLNSVHPWSVGQTPEHPPTLKKEKKSQHPLNLINTLSLINITEIIKIIAGDQMHLDGLTQGLKVARSSAKQVGGFD